MSWYGRWAYPGGEGANNLTRSWKALVCDSASDRDDQGIDRFGPPSTLRARRSDGCFGRLIYAAFETLPVGRSALRPVGRRLSSIDDYRYELARPRIGPGSLNEGGRTTGGSRLNLRGEIRELPTESGVSVSAVGVEYGWTGRLRRPIGSRQGVHVSPIKRR